MKCRKINYVDEGFDTLASEMSADPKAILRLKPVNYYAIKNKYIMGKVYTSEDYQRIMCSFSDTSMTTSAEKLISSPVCGAYVKGSCKGGHNNRPESPCQRPVRKRKWLQNLTNLILKPLWLTCFIPLWKSTTQ